MVKVARIAEISSDPLGVIALELIQSLTLCDHMGDVANEIQDALKKAGVEIDWDDLGQLNTILSAHDVKTLSGL